MERREKEEKARQEVDAVKRRLVFEKEEREKEEKKKEEQRKEENRKRKEEAEKKRKQKTPMKRGHPEEIALFSSDDEIPTKRGRLFNKYISI